MQPDMYHINKFHWKSYLVESKMVILNYLSDLFFIVMYFLLKVCEQESFH